jgi:hypothetical protein
MSNLLPDVYVEPQPQEGVTLLVANKKARRFFNKSFGRPQWDFTAGPDLNSPEYRCLVLGADGKAAAAMLCAAHQAGLSAMFKCTKCNELHVVDDEQAERLWLTAIEGAANAMPAHPMLQ